jgi:hypothetical protein
MKRHSEKNGAAPAWLSLHLQLVMIVQEFKIRIFLSLTHDMSGL